jgi:hypothetical protein
VSLEAKRRTRVCGPDLNWNAALEVLNERRLRGLLVAQSSAPSERLFSGRPSRTSLSLISLGMVVFLSALMYVVKNFHTALPTNREPCSANCTLYASPSGNDQNAGTSAGSPKTLLGAAAAARPGSTVCILAGSYQLSSSFIPPTSGTSSAWIVYKNCDGGTVNFIWAGPADASAMFKIGSGQFPSDPAYLEFRGLNLDGHGNAADGFFCRGSHHLRFIGNSISNTGASGIGSINCDYLTADHNIVNHNGYIPASTAVPKYYSWSSGISFNSNQWFDNYHGFHNVVSNNIVTGEVDQSSKHSDGNGIILDLSNRTYDYKSANTPPALIVNNVVFGNGGRCIEAYTVTNFWIVNNTCYGNNLDRALETDGSITVNNSNHGYVINNIAVALNRNTPPYCHEHTVAGVVYFSDMYSGASVNFAYSDPSQLIEGDPLFVDAPVLDRAVSGQNTFSSSPSQLGSGLKVRPSSPAIDRGIDPTALADLPADVVKDLKKYVYTDVNGNPRPRGGHFDLGAYQSKPMH